MEPVADLVALRDGDSPFPTLPACAIEDETRPAIGCLYPTRLGAETGLVPAGGTIAGRRYHLPANVTADVVLVERAFRRGERDGWTPLAPFVAHRDGEDVEVSYPLPPEAPAGP